MAARIRARAMRRAGELLKQIEPGKTCPKQLTDAADTQLSRTEVAKRAGMSERQQVTAVRVASIPERQFTEQAAACRRDRSSVPAMGPVEGRHGWPAGSAVEGRAPSGAATAWASGSIGRP